MKLFLFLSVFLTLYANEPDPTNHLITETSPYLQQHAHNPVEWYPWGDAAFEKARQEHKPIFLSIGYSTCHWCHVMEEESFEDEEVARVLNASYISIKVDKEEMPHIDKYYQKLHLLLKNRNGGWPLTVILTESRQPFFITTYVPKEDGYGAKGMMNILPDIANRYARDRTSVHTYAASIERLMHQVSTPSRDRQDVGLEIIGKALGETRELYDEAYHGFSSEPKFPESSRIALLLDIHALDGNPDALAMAENTMRTMARGGIYDQIEGAFFRYAVNRTWQIPHFEKMLYTNAELVPLYARLYRHTEDPLFAKVVTETISELDTRFRHNGLYFSASDADSDGQEGHYFLYDYKAMHTLLRSRGFAPDEAHDVLVYFGITEDGNFDSEASNPYINGTDAPPRSSEARKIMQAVRALRPFPFIDRKVITSWNAMMATALFEASVVNEENTAKGVALLQRLLETMYVDGTLYHQTIDASPPRQKALLEDYAFLIRALLSAYRVTLDISYLKQASIFTDAAINRFYQAGQWYLADDGFDTLADLNDRYYTAPLSVMFHNLLVLGTLSGKMAYYDLGRLGLEQFSSLLARNPGAYPEATRAMLRHLKGDIVIKSTRPNLMAIKSDLHDNGYPYLHMKVEETDRYLACRAGSCFAYSRSPDELFKAIGPVQ